MRRLALSCAFACACYTPHPQAGAPCSDLAPCPSTQTCFAGHCYDDDAGVPALDAAVDARADAVPDAPCTLMCAGSQLFDTCGDIPMDCAAGCSMEGGAHCEVVVPSNG